MDAETSQAMTALVEKLKENKLLIKEDGKSKLDLTVFNKNLENASKNLGIIVPSIVEVSKEQVALVNNGLEGTINFIRAFQTFNTAFAVFAEEQDIVNKMVYKIDELENLENKIIDEVGSNLENLDEMLTETFKEVAGYYTALGHIIYSEEEGGMIEVKYERSTALKDKMSKIYTRKDELKKDFKMEKSLGLVQLIESLVNVDKEVRKIRIDEKTEKTEYYITGTTEGKPEASKIKIDIDMVNALKGISSELLGSLQGAGVLVQDESKRINVIKQEALEQKFVAQSGKKAVEEIKRKLAEHSKITKFLKDNNIEIKRLGIFNAKEQDKAKVYEEITGKEKENDQAKKAHDQIIKNQMDLIIEVVNAFGSIISLWGDQVSNEISIAQVADKAVIAIDKLSKVEIKANINAEGLLVARTTQEQIKKTCEGAKELKNVGKIMQMLLQRVKSLLSYNQGLEAQIRQFHGTKKEANDYKKEELKNIKKLLYERYPGISLNVSKAMKEFNKKVAYLVESKNKKENQQLITNMLSTYNNIEKSIKIGIERIGEQTELVTKDISKFPDGCKELGLTLNATDDKIDNIFDSFRGFRKTFEGDFEVYSHLSDDYSIIVNGINPFLEIIDHIIETQLKLAQKKIDLKVVNQSLKAFTMLFEENKKILKEEDKVNTDLLNMMKEVGLSETDYYKKYKDDLKESGKLLEELEKEVSNYFKDAENKTGEAYKLANDWVSTFSVNFRTYNQEFKDLKTGLFDRFLKTIKYKEKNFFSELKNIKKSFAEIDSKVNKLSKLNLKKPKDVAEFCKFSTEFVNDIVSGYKDLIKEITYVVEIMHLVNENLTKLKDTKLDKLKGLIEKINILNDKLNSNEDKYVDLEEFDRLNVTELFDSLKKLSDFSELSKRSSQEFKELSKSKDSILSYSEKLRNNLLIFYTTYLTKVLPVKEKDKYEKILKEAKSKI